MGTEENLMKLSGDGNFAEMMNLYYTARFCFLRYEPYITEELFLIFLKFLQSIIPFVAREENDNVVGHVIRKDGTSTAWCPDIISLDELDCFSEIVLPVKGGELSSETESLLKQVKREILGLGNIADPCHIEPLVDMLDDVCPYVQCTAIWALGVIGDSRVLKHLVPKQRDTSALIRYEVAMAIVKIQSIRSVEYFLLDDNDSNVRSLAARELSYLAKAKLVEYLIPLLDDNDSNVRSLAARNLSYMADEKLLESLVAPLLLIDKWTWTNPVANDKAKKDLWNAAVRTVYSRLGL